MRVLLPVLLAVAGCSSGADTIASTSSAAPVTALQVEVVPSPGAAPRRWTLTCSPTGGDHPRAADACESLAEQRAPLAPLEQDRACTELYGGPQTAQVRGTYRGEQVALELSRTDGCRIAQWDALGAVLGPVE